MGGNLRASPCDLNMTTPSSSSLRRRCKIASSSSRASRSMPGPRALGLQRVRREAGASASGPDIVIVATPSSARPNLDQGIARPSRPRRTPIERRQRDAPACGSAPPCREFLRARPRRSPRISNSAPLRRPAAIRAARLPFTPSSMEQNTSARSRRTLRLSVTRVRPPVPGSTASSGTSGSATDRRAVVGQDDVIAGERELVAAARARALDGADIMLARTRRRQPRRCCGSRW